MIEPSNGLVILYDYLWARQYDLLPDRPPNQGSEQGREVAHGLGYM
jgi:hypothetical protein